jgi:ABC-type Zn uptake system ZnuABC Zn-binding protein ZnuA/ABC-type Mn2+/Zn2+ transport system permease subunit
MIAPPCKEPERRDVLETFQLAFVQRGIVEILLLSIASGLLGTWIVLRGLAFFSHAVGTAAFPGLVLADGLGFPAAVGAFGTAIACAIGVSVLAGRRRTGYDSVTALVLVGCLAAGVILASDVFQSGAEIETLLFGSLLVIGGGDLLLAGIAAALVAAATVSIGPRWLAIGFDPDAARAIGVRSRAPDLVLLALTAVVTIAALSAVGALLASALIVVPAATVRLWTRRLLPWQAGSVLLAAIEGVAGIWLSVETNAPPGATIAVISGGVFGLAVVARGLRRPLGRRLAGAAAGALVLAVVTAGCGGSAGGSAGLDVVATSTQLGDIVRTVGGNRVDLHQILKPNTDPHDYEPRPDDIRATAGAALVFTSGDNLDTWMGTVISEAGGDPTVVDVGATVPVRLPGESSGAEASEFDPHWWHDPVNVEAAAGTIQKALAAADPAGADLYAANAKAYMAKVRALDSGIAACMRKVPPSKRKLVTDHDAFGYFAHRYGITVVGAVIPSQTTQAQPSAGDVADLSRLIEEEGVTAVFPESSVSPKLARAIAAETGASVGPSLYGDTLGPDDSPGATYLGMERANADAMVRGFTGGARGCSIPAIG